MRILKIKGKNETVVLEQIKQKYGDTAVVLSTYKEKENGRFNFFKPSKTVVTIAIKDEADEEIETLLEVSPQKVMIQSSQQETAEMFQSLNEQMKRMESVLRGIERSESTTQTTIPNTYHLADNERISLLKEKLLDLGVQEALCGAILQNINDEMEGQIIVQTMYEKIQELIVTEENTEENTEELPQRVFFVGSTGVGKTTTIAKLTAQYVLEKGKKVVLFTSDTYRIAAIEQLKTYADILGVPIEVIYDENDIPMLLEKWKHADHIFIDTAGRSHKNEIQVNELISLLRCVDHKKVFLVVNASTGTRDVMNIIDTYSKVEDEIKLIITKLDETDEIGNLLNIAYYAQCPVAYITTGQNVPADIEQFSTEQYIINLLGRIQ